MPFPEVGELLRRPEPAEVRVRSTRHGQREGGDRVLRVSPGREEPERLGGVAGLAVAPETLREADPVRHEGEREAAEALEARLAGDLFADKLGGDDGPSVFSSWGPYTQISGTATKTAVPGVTSSRAPSKTKQASRLKTLFSPNKSAPSTRSFIQVLSRSPTPS